MIDTPKHLSPTSASTFDGCSQKWRFKYVDRLPDPSGHSALVGNFVHLVLENLCELEPSRRTQEMAKSLASSMWDGFATEADYVALDLSPEAERAFKWQAWMAMVGLWQLEDPASVEVVSTEQKILTDIAGVPFKGIVDRIDRVDGKLVISDYKSGKLPGARWRSDKIQQIMLYAAAVSAAQNEVPSTARLLYLGQRTIEVEVTQKRLDVAGSQLSDTWESVKTACAEDSFNTSPSVLCGWCSFVAHCEAGQKEVRKRISAGTIGHNAPGVEILTRLESHSDDRAA